MDSRYLLSRSILGTVAIIAFQSHVAMALSPDDIAKIAKQVTVQIKSVSHGSGSGVLIRQEGEAYTVLTAAHVVPAEDQFTVSTSDEQSYPVKFSSIQPLPGLDLAYYNCGVSKHSLGDTRGAISDYDQVIQHKSDFAPAFLNRGISRENLGNRQGAVADLQTAAKIFKAQGDQPKYKLSIDLLQKLGY
jgi:tetratricopeptide (TPR) repeat protein